jgi:hypothetical protein
MIVFAFIVLIVSTLAASGKDCELHDPPKEGAFEILQMHNCTVYIGVAKDIEEVTEEKFKKWSPSNGWMLNPGGVRHTTFDRTCLYSSPGKEEKEEIRLAASEPWSPLKWFYLANFCPSDLVLGGCFPGKCNGDM